MANYQANVDAAVVQGSEVDLADDFTLSEFGFEILDFEDFSDEVESVYGGASLPRTIIRDRMNPLEEFHRPGEFK